MSTPGDNTAAPGDNTAAPGEEYNPGPATTPRQAASVILLRGGAERLEVLLVRRTPKARFMGGVWVFPGGAVDAGEGDGDSAPPAPALRGLRCAGATTRRAPSARPFGADHVGDGVDQREVRERLRVVAELATAGRLELLAVQLQRRGVRQQPLAQVLGLAVLADLRQRRDEPERADQERPLLAVKPVVGLVRAVAKDQPVFGQLDS